MLNATTLENTKLVLERSAKDVPKRFAKKLLKHKRVRIKGLGFFELARYPSKRTAHPATGEIQYTRPYYVVKFKPTKHLKQELQDHA